MGSADHVSRLGFTYDGASSVSPSGCMVHLEKVFIFHGEKIYFFNFCDAIRDKQQPYLHTPFPNSLCRVRGCSCLQVASEGGSEVCV